MTDSLPRPLVLFDGTCHLCQRSVRFILRHERGPELRFASLQSEAGERALRDFEVPQGIDAMVLVEKDHTWIASDAALRLASYLRPPYSWARFLRILPRCVHGALYRWIARNRYLWFGRDETCPLPEPGQAERFLHD